MAGRRCFSDKIVESDAFYALSVNAQALYYHLNQAADDDGFINSASSIAGKIKKGKAALEELVKHRFLLRFKDIYVVKHWRISNSLKNDRLKPLAYDGIAAQIWIKPNKAYTDHPVEGCKTLLEVKTGIHLESTLESSWNPVGIPTEPKRTEENRTEEKRTEHTTGMRVLFKELWNDYPELKRGSDKQAWDTFQTEVKDEEEASIAIRNLARWKASKQWAKEGGRFIPYLSNWLDRGGWKAPPAQAAEGEVGFTLGAAELNNIQRLIGGNKREG